MAVREYDGWDWVLVFRQIARATDQRTTLASIVPKKVGLSGGASVIDVGDFGWNLRKPETIQNESQHQHESTQTELF